MSSKEIYIDGIRVGYGTGVKGSPEPQRNETQTFDGIIQAGNPKVGYTVEIEMIQSESMDEFIALDQCLDEMLSIKKPVTVVEKITDNNGDTWTLTRHYLRCLIDSNSYELKPDDLTTNSLSFKAEELTKKYE